MKIDFCRNRIWDLKSEKGFTLLELIMIVTMTGIISSTLVIPFTTGIKQATRPEIYATATYLAQQKIEEQRGLGYSSCSGSSTIITKKGRDYQAQVVTEYVDHYEDPVDDNNNTFNSASVTPSTYIKVTVTVSNTTIPDDIVLWTILAKDTYDPDPV